MNLDKTKDLRSVTEPKIAFLTASYISSDNENFIVKNHKKYMISEMINTSIINSIHVCIRIHSSFPKAAICTMNIIISMKTEIIVVMK